MRSRLRLPAQPDDDAVGRPLRLHLDDGAAATGLHRPVDPLRDHAVEPETLEILQPGAGGEASATDGDRPKTAA